MADPLAAIRARYAAEIMIWARRAGLPTERVEAAFRTVPRERYLPPPPWRLGPPRRPQDASDTFDPSDLYADVLVVLDGARGINNGQPSLHAAWMAGVDPGRGETVVQVGIGTGYYTAILAELVGRSGRVEAYEIEPGLAEQARRNLAGLPQVAVHAASGLGVALPEADVVYVSAGATMPDAAWLRALRPGGRLVFPWQPFGRHGEAMSIRRRPGGLAVRLHGSVSFMRCVGPDGPEMECGASPQPRPAGETRSAWLVADLTPDETATAVGREVWLSAREA